MDYPLINVSSKKTIEYAIDEIIDKHLKHLGIIRNSSNVLENTHIIFINIPSPINYKRVYKDNNFRMYYNEENKRLKIFILHKNVIFPKQEYSYLDLLVDDLY